MFLAAGIATASPVAACTSWFARGFNFSLRTTLSLRGHKTYGESVLHIEWEKSVFNIDTGRKYTPKVTGEAVIVPTSNDENIFGLITPLYRHPGFIAPRVDDIFALYTQSQNAPPVPEYYNYLSSLKGRFPVPRAQWPVFVRFREESDPNGIEFLDPSHIVTRSGSASVEAVDIAVTDRPLTTGIEGKLPWLRLLWEQERVTGRSLSIKGGTIRISSRNFKLRGEPL